MSDWGAGWCPPLTASPAEPSGLEAARVLDACAPAFGVPALWGWQRQVCAVLLSRRDGVPRWSSVAVIVCRQNGKTTLLQVAVWGLMMLGRRVLFALHERQKGREKWAEIAAAVSRVAPARYRVSRRGGGEIVTDLRTGGHCRLVTPDDSGGRSFTADTLIADEAAFMNPSFLGSAAATMLTSSDAQTVLVSSAGTAASADLAQARSAAIAGVGNPDSTAALIEWGVTDQPGRGDLDVTDETLWERAIPTLDQPGGARRDRLRNELERGVDHDDFAREYLGIWTGDPLDCPIPTAAWQRAQTVPDDTDRPGGLHSVVIAADSAPDQSSAAVAVAGRRPDGATVVMLASAAADDDWLADDIAELYRLWRPMRVVIDGISPAAAAAETLRSRGIPVDITGAAAMSRSCAALVAMLTGDAVRVVSDDTLTAAALASRRRLVADGGWAFARAATPISPIVAAALAVHAAVQQPAGIAATAAIAPEWADADDAPDQRTPDASDRTVDLDAAAQLAASAAAAAGPRADRPDRRSRDGTARLVGGDPDAQPADCPHAAPRP